MRKFDFGKFLGLLTLQLFFAYVAIAGKEGKIFTTADKVYEDNIKTVLLYPYSGSKSDVFVPPVVSINQDRPLLLSFDDLNEQTESYYIKIIYCNADWQISTLSAIQYLYDFNEFFITERNTSINAKVPYIHYSVVLPKVKISGNYLVKVYRNGNEDDLILTKRFMVYENLIQITPDIRLPQMVSERNTGQQVNFSISYPNYPLINPAGTLKVSLRQNYRWDNMLHNLPPLFVKENQHMLDYNYFNMENGFKGGNEFNAFDISSLITYKLNISKIIEAKDTTEVILVEDKPISSQPYSSIQDIDGRFFIEHYETEDATVSPDYAYVNFVLNTAPIPDGKIYVIGAMNDWSLKKDFQMVYNKEIKKYTCRALLKQGYYNYRYVLVNAQYPSGNDIYFSGSHSQTQNNYEILAYYRPPGERADYLIGYSYVNFMARK